MNDSVRTIVRCLWLFLVATVCHAGDPVRVAVLYDGPSWYFEDLVVLVEQEIVDLAERPVTFVAEERFNAQWDPERIPDILDAALADADVDIILAAGMLLAQAANHNDRTLTKPVVAGFPQDSALSRFRPKENFSFVISRERVPRDVVKMNELFQFDTLAILIDEVLARHLDGVGALSDQLEEQLGMPVHLISVTDDVDEALARVPDDVTALYVTPLIRMDNPSRARLFSALADRRILTFSLLGDVDVQQGALAGITPYSQTRLARRLALNILALADGRTAESLPREFNVPEQLTFNEDTIRRTGYRHSLGVMLQTSLIERDPQPADAAPLTLHDALRTALSNSRRIAAAAAATMAANEDRRQARSVLFPQIEGQASYLEIDQDRAAASFGLQPRSRASAGVTARQVLYNNQVFSQLRAAERLAERSQWEEESQRLDVVQLVALRFFDALSANALLKVESDELERIRENLEFARLRVDIGQTGQEDAWRWEAEEARQVGSLLTARANVIAAHAALNQAMGLPSNTPWHLESVELEDAETYFMDDELAFATGDFETIAVLGRFWQQMALDVSPQLQAINAALAAQRIEARALRRSRYVPEVGVQANYDYVIDRRTSGPDLGVGLTAAGLPITPTDPPDHEWSVAVVMSVPVFDSGLRRHQAARSRADFLNILALSQEAAQQTELAVIDAYQRVMASQPAIRLSRTRARAARDSLNLIQERYQQGTAGILDLLDVQGRAFAADQAAVLAVNQYLQDLTRFQRAISWFAWLQPEESRQQLVNEIHEFLENNR